MEIFVTESMFKEKGKKGGKGGVEGEKKGSERYKSFLLVEGNRLTGYYFVQQKCRLSARINSTGIS